MLSEHPMTESQISKKIGLTRSAVGYHLNPLLKANLIYLKKVEAEKHGILQKFYSPIAAFFAVKYDSIPCDVERFFVQMQIEQLRGVFSALQLHQRFTSISPENLEKLAKAMVKQLEHTCQEYEGEQVVENAETIKIKVYTDALTALLQQDEWASLITE
jgi:DNA-binding transcriptional ArsR family regulator